MDRILLRMMLWLLGLAAASGVLAVFLPGWSVTGRVALTLLAGAMATLAAMRSHRRMELPGGERVGRISLIVIVVGFVLALAAIWGNSLRIGDELRGTAIIYLVAAVIATPLMVLSTRDGGRIAGTVGVGLIVAALAAALAATWIPVLLALPAGSTLWEQCWGTVMTLSLFAIPICTSLWGTQRGDRRPVITRWPLLGAAAGVIGLLVQLGIVWFSGADEPGFWPVQCWIVGTTIGLVNAVLTFASGSLPPPSRWLGMATALAVIALGASGTVLNLEHHRISSVLSDLDDSLPGKLVAASAILTTCGALAIAIAAALARRRARFGSLAGALEFPPSGAASPGAADRVLTSVTAIALTCPHCALASTQPLGESRCARCGLRYLLRVAEPRCATCDYPLLDVRSGTCPECGAKVER